MAAGAGGEVVGTVLDATGVGIAPGVALQAGSATLIAGGATAAAAGATQLAMHAMGDDHVSPMQTNSTSGGGGETEPPFPPPKEITGQTEHGAQQMAERDGHGVSDAAAKDAVDNPVKPPKYRPDQYGGAYRFTGKDAVVNLNQEGKVVTAWARSKAGWRQE
ncbi:hypothetical protein [Amycolatopsis alkalitolerans]|uniref:Bacterial toxin 24 domain-containing protein n=1 Tax=Amycolatopsis alkalitolerans TaxID=2547244 RepID=A0A5C4M010_9PSEU|nr:hypothetical protein [Amycolatopsis alkalitolerans]TNC23746.1 hypothetical protein FG385_20510 [Amycolatopsis alkalitolerans]